MITTPFFPINVHSTHILFCCNGEMIFSFTFLHFLCITIASTFLGNSWNIILLSLSWIGSISSGVLVINIKQTFSLLRRLFLGNIFAVFFANRFNTVHPQRPWPGWAHKKHPYLLLFWLDMKNSSLCFFRFVFGICNIPYVLCASSEEMNLLSLFLLCCGVTVAAIGIFASVWLILVTRSVFTETKLTCVLLSNLILFIHSCNKQYVDFAIFWSLITVLQSSDATSSRSL